MITERQDLIEKAIDDINLSAVKVQEKWRRNIVRMFDELDLDKQGQIKPTGKNIKTTSRIQRRISEMIKNDPEYKKSVEKFISTFDKVANLTDKYYADLSK